MNTELVLHLRAVVPSRQQRAVLWLMALVAVLMLIVTAFLVYKLAAGKPVDWGSLAARLYRQFREDPLRRIELAIFLLALAGHALYLPRAKKYQRLILNDAGIRYESPLPAWLRAIDPNWFLPWEQVRGVRYEMSALGTAPAFVTLVLDGGAVKRTVRPYAWVDPVSHEHAPAFKLPRRLSPTQVIAELERTPLIKFIAQRLATDKLNFTLPEGVAPFSLEKSPAAIGAVAVFLMALAYAYLDTFIFNAETYVQDPSLDGFVFAGFGAGVLAFALMRRSKVPLTESAVVSLLTGAAIGAALYPGLLRVNQLTDTKGLVPHEYRMTTIGSFEAADAQLPPIHFPERHVDFWMQFKPGHVETFELRRGALGFYQINMAPIYERTNAFYEKRRR